MKFKIFLLFTLLLALFSDYELIKGLAADQSSALSSITHFKLHSEPVIKIAQAQDDLDNPESSQRSNVKYVSFKILYNKDNSDFITKEFLESVLREITTNFIGTGYIYSTKDNADIKNEVFLDFDITSYDQQNQILYDVISKLTLKAFDNNDKLLAESSQNIFLSGNQLSEVALKSSRKAASIASKETIESLEKLLAKNTKPEDNMASIKIEIVFQGNKNYQYFDKINDLLTNSPFNLKIIKRAIDPETSFSMILISNVESEILARYISENNDPSVNLELIDNNKSRLVFNITD